MGGFILSWAWLAPMECSEIQILILPANILRILSSIEIFFSVQTARWSNSLQLTFRVLRISRNLLPILNILLLFASSKSLEIFEAGIDILILTYSLLNLAFIPVVRHFEHVLRQLAQLELYWFKTVFQVECVLAPFPTSNIHRFPCNCLKSRKIQYYSYCRDMAE